MSRTIMWAWILILGAGMAFAQENNPDPGIQPMLDAVEQALGETGSLAILRPEATGTTADLSGLEALLVESLGRREDLTIEPPEAVFRQVGPEFPISAEGLAGVAEQAGADAALFVRVFSSPDKTELHVLLVDAGASLLLDKAFPIGELPPGKMPPGAPPGDPAGPPSPAAVPKPEPPESGPGPGRAASTPAVEAAGDPHAHRRLSLAPRNRVVGGASLGVAGRTVALGFHTPVMLATDWMILEGDRPISELQLARLAGQQDIARRIQEDISSLKTIRNVGVGMTLGGFVTAGIAFPFVKAEGDDQVTTAGVLVGTGLATGAAGLILWLLYGPDAGLAETPYPVHHLISRQEAEKMVRDYNQALREEAAPAPPPETGPGALRIVPCPAPAGGGLALRWSF